jgi:hypothetical protein
MDLLALFNGCEAALWFAVAVIFLRVRINGLTPHLLAWLVLSYALFGISDLIEMRTGAWWRPPALLVFKGACLLALATGLTRLIFNRRARGRATPNNADELGFFSANAFRAESPDA